MTAADMNEEVFACPVFEGSEKRISVTFAAGPNTPPHGLRSLSRAQLDAMLDLAACQIVSYRSNAHFDAYVLSESSLFVYPDRMVLKTCGTTKLLSCVEYMEELAASLGMAPSRVKYTRASFLFPEQQPAPHTSFDHECQFLHGAFSHLGRTSAYVLGDALNGLQWHVFVAGLCDLPAKPLAPPPPRRRQPPLSPTWPAGGTNPPAAACRCSLGSRCHCYADFGTDEAGLSSQSAERPIYTLEVCMTGLSARKAAQFFRGVDFVSAQHVTLGSGIQGLVPGAVIDDYVFEPCGYSMNGQQGGVFSTIHITPEDGFSYASFELCGYDPEAVDTADLVSRVVEVFHPGQVGVTLSLDSSASAAATLGWSGGFLIPPKYVAHSSSYQEFKAGGYVAYFALEGERAAAGKAGSDSDASSPRAVLKHCPSFHTITPLGSEDAMHDTASDDSRGAGAHVGSPSAFMRASLMSSMSGLSLMGSSAEIGVEDVLALHNAVPLLRGDGASVDGHMRGLISRHRLEDTFFVVDLGAVQRCYSAWTEAMPGVRPYYTVRCNPDRALLSMLAALGCGFSCAAESEVHLVLSLGIPADRILFSSACKRPRDVRFAAQKGVRLTTFACVGELCKLARWQPGARVLLRLTAAHSVDSAGAAGRGADGADPASWTELFQTAQALGVEVAGVSVALGAAADVDRALVLAKQAFDTGRAHGCAMKVLDIGCAAFEAAHCQAGDTLATLTAALCPALDAHFPTGCGVRVMAEAGHCFAESAATLASLVYARRLQPSREGYDYWVAADGQAWAGGGACGAGAGTAPRALLMHGAGAKAAPCTVHGPAAGALCCALPECQEGDWVVLPRWGAYCGAGEVLGAMDTPTFYVCSREA